MRLDAFDHILKPGELRLRRSRRPLYLIEVIDERIHRTAQIRHIEPNRCEQERCIQDEFDKAAKEGVAPHVVQHLVVLTGKTQHLAHFILNIWIHMDQIIPLLSTCAVRTRWI